MHRTPVALSLLPLALALATTGCNKSSSNNGFASTAAPVKSATPTTKFPTGNVAPTTSSTNPGVTNQVPPPVTAPTDSTPPVITVTSPARGLETTQSSVLFEGTVTDAGGAGLDYVMVNGNVVQVGPNGLVQEAVTLSHGLNMILVETADLANNRSQAVVPVVHGQFLPANQMVEEAVVMRLNQGAFDRIEDLANAQLSGQFLSQAIMARNPLFSGSSGIIRFDVEPRSASFGDPNVSIQPSAQGLQVTATVDNVDIDTRIRGRLALFIPLNLRTNVTANRVTLTATANASVGANGQVDTTLQNVNVDISGFRFDIAYVPGFLENLARNRVRRLIEEKVEEQINGVVPGLITQALAGAMQNMPFNVLNRQVTVQLAPNQIDIDANGATVGVHGNLQIPAPAGTTPPASLGSLLTPGRTSPTVDQTRDLQLSANVDMLNRMAHAAWQGGLVDMTFDANSIQSLGLPAAISLDGFFLMSIFPTLQGMLNPTDEVDFQITAGVSPIFDSLPNPDFMQVEMGDLTLSVFAGPAGQSKQLVMRLGLQVRADVAVSMTPADRLLLTVSRRPDVELDIFEAPLAPLNVIELQNLVDVVLPIALQHQGTLWSGLPLPVIPGMQPSNVEFSTEAQAPGYLTIKGDI